MLNRCGQYEIILTNLGAYQNMKFHHSPLSNLVNKKKDRKGIPLTLSFRADWCSSKRYALVFER